MKGGEVRKLFVGELRESSSLSRAELMKQSIVKVNEKSDLVIASCGGMPHDINLVQAHKCLRKASNITNLDDGIMLIEKCGKRYTLDK